MANVLKVFLENGQTKSFKYDSTTTVQVDKISLWKDKVFRLLIELLPVDVLGCRDVAEGETLHHGKRTF